jgi:sortase A
MKRLVTFFIICVGLGIPLLINQKNNTEDKPVIQKEIPQAQPTQRDVEIGEPLGFSIPKLKIESAVEYVGMTPEGRMGDPEDPQEVAWWKLGARPGQKGSAVLAGHLDTPQGTPGIFWDLDTLEIGDEIIVNETNGNDLVFEVFDKQIYEDANFPINEVFGKSDGYYLNLITCEGTFDSESKNYDKRYVIFSHLK